MANSESFNSSEPDASKKPNQTQKVEVVVANPSSGEVNILGELSINACNELNISMIFTGKRHFLH